MHKSISIENIVFTKLRYKKQTAKSITDAFNLVKFTCKISNTFKIEHFSLWVQLPHHDPIQGITGPTKFFISEKLMDLAVNSRLFIQISNDGCVL